MLVTGEQMKIYTHACCTKNRKQNIFLYLYGGGKEIQEDFIADVTFECGTGSTPGFLQVDKGGENIQSRENNLYKKGEQVT